MGNSKKMRFDNTQNDLRHWCLIHTPFRETRLNYQIDYKKTKNNCDVNVPSDMLDIL